LRLGCTHRAWPHAFHSAPRQERMARPPAGLTSTPFRPSGSWYRAIGNGSVTTGSWWHPDDRPPRRSDRGRALRSLALHGVGCLRTTRRGVMRRQPRPEGNWLMSSQIHPDQPADGSAEGAKHPGPSRRSVLYGAAGLAGAGLAATAIGTLAAPAAAASASAARQAHTGQAAGAAS